MNARIAETRQRQLAGSLVVGIAVLASIVTGTLTGKAQEVVEAGVIGDAVDVAQCDGGTPSGAAEVFTIQADGSSTARYRVQEELRGIGDTEAVGETNAVLGTLYLDEAGLPLPCSRIDVDLRTLQSDEARRDNYLYSNTLETETYPLATFIVTEANGLEGSLASGEDASFLLIGNLTIHGEARQVAWQITATRDGDAISGLASTSFDMPDFSIEPPMAGPVVSLDEQVALEIDVTATLAP